jgi:Protein kinase domain/PEGA domain
VPNPDEPKKKPVQPTLQWDPGQGPRPEVGEAPTPPAQPEEEDALVGQLLRDKWKVLKRLGAGSFGTVYKVQDVKGGWIEALKILGVDRITGAEAANVRARFLREAQIMKRLGTQSAHIVGLSTYEEDLEAGLIYFLMEFVEGRSLGDALIEEGPFSVERTVRLALQVCEALTVAHEGPDGVVHRDLKLENLMLTRDRTGAEMVKVLDFGIAKLAEKDADSRLTTTGTLGTPGYAAPEQLRAEAVDGRTDLFAFGVILYSLLTGRDPWLGNPAGVPTTQIYELMVATDRGEVLPMADTGVEVPPAMEQVVLRLLRRDPAERFQSAHELEVALERIARGGEALEAGSIRALTDQPGVQVEIRSGRHTVAEGPTPCMADAVAPGTYRIVVKDPRYEPVETTVTLAPGAMEDVTLVITARSTGVGATLHRAWGRIAAAAVVVVLAAGVVVVRPWGRTLDLSALKGRVAAGAVRSAQLTASGIQGTLSLGPIPVRFKVPLAENDMAKAVSDLRAVGLNVNTSWEVSRLIRMAMQAQARMRYYGSGDDDVEDYAKRVAALDPGSAEAKSLLLKTAEHMAWDAAVAREDGAADSAKVLVDQCLALVPGHPDCKAVGAGH